MAKTKKPPKSRDVYPKLPAQSDGAAPAKPPWFRETVESIVIAFVLAFLFRTFEAEAFVIPTGSMAPTLMGRHKDVYCSQCGHRFQISASEEVGDDTSGRLGAARQEGKCVAGVCPMCRFTMPMQTGLPEHWLRDYPVPDIANHRSYNGDRILVNKYVYTVSDPERWDVVVFKYPGDAQMNYIKRLVGLPGETLRVYQGDLFVKRDGETNGEFRIERKPADKVLAMRQLVHDTDYDPAALYDAGWPLRWSAPESGNAWQLSAEPDGQNVRQRFAFDGTDGGTQWIRYRNYAPNFQVWGEVLAGQQREAQGGAPARIPPELLDNWQPQLVMDFNAYNTRVTGRQAQVMNGIAPDPSKLGIHWVGDLMVEADVDVEEARGELVLDLVEAGQHFTCTIDLTTGEAKLGILGLANYAPTAQTPLSEPGSYRVGFANFDNELYLFVKKRSALFSELDAGDLVAFEGGTAFDAAAVFGEGGRIAPETSPEDPGDLAPVGIGARGAKLAIDRLQVWRDIYYIATSWQSHRPGAISDYRELDASIVQEIAYNPQLWRHFLDRREEQFELGEDQFFVMGDNSPESSDARLWLSDMGRGKPGGAYLERRMLIGKALCVYWPHSWNRIPGTPIPFPLFPNLADMRLVR